MELPLLQRRSVLFFQVAVLLLLQGGFFIACYLSLNKEAIPIKTRQNVKISVQVIIGVTPFTIEVTNRQTATLEQIISIKHIFVNHYL
jgi:hypothetical protein